MPVLKDREQKLFCFLHAWRDKGRPFTVANVIEATGYSAATVKTYLAKKLRRSDLVVSTEGGGAYLATIPRGYSEADFKRLMTQVVEDPLEEIQAAPEWASYLTRVISFAEARRFRLTDEELGPLIARLKALVD